MKLLAVDTSSDAIVLALANGDKKDYFVGEKGAKRHNAALLSDIDAFLERNDMSLQDVDVFGVVVGPGSFTGIRIGVATVNAFSLALHKKIVAVTSLELPVDGRGRVLTALDCRHDNFYCGIFENGEAEYLPLTREEIEKADCPVVYLSGNYQEELLEKCLLKAEKGEFYTQAKPFYLKRSSAERETGILC